MNSATNGSTPLTVARVNPLEFERPLKDFMVANGHGTFPEFFDRGYPSAVRDGAATWVGLADGDRVQLSITRFVHTVVWGDRRLAVGMLGNLMAAAEVRTFFPAVQVVRRMLADSRAEGRLDLVCTDGTPKAAAIFKGAGMRIVGHLERFVFPLRDDRRHADMAAAAYLGWRRLRDRRAVSVSRHAAAEFDARAFDVPAGHSDRIRPEHASDLYRRRLPGYPSAADYWFTFGLDEGTAPAAALVRWPDEEGIAALHSIRRPPNTPLAPLVNGLVRELRRCGADRLHICAVENGQLARELTQAGFIPRNDRMPLLALPLTAAGQEAVGAIAEWEITAFDMER